MLTNQNAMATISVKNLSAARKFYEGTLGFKPLDMKGYEDCVQFYKAGDSTIEVYESDFAGTNKATSLTWSIPDIKKEVDELKKKGVKFEHYENMPDTKLEGDIHVMGPMKNAWFKDPDGNIFCLASLAH